MSRHPHWESRLAALVDAKAATPHDYGRWDCIMMPLAVAQAVTGKDHGRGHRGKYSTKVGAGRYLKQLGFDTPGHALDSIFADKPVGFAQRGDIVLASDGIPALCMGGFALSVGQDGTHEGWVRVDRADWVKAWAIGDQYSDWTGADE